VIIVGKELQSVNYFSVTKFATFFFDEPVPAAARSKAQVCGRSPAEIVGSNSTGGMDVCLLSVLSDKVLCVGLITRPEDSYRLWRVVVCDLEGHSPSWNAAPKNVL
jgi:hypothetical protein